MSVYRILEGKMGPIESLFRGWNETVIWSCLQGYMGSAWADHEDVPGSGQIVVGDFCFFAGEPNSELVKNKPITHESDFIIMVPQDDAWAKLIEKVYEEDAMKVTRYATKKEPSSFDENKLKTVVRDMDPNYEIRLIDEAIFDEAMANDWSRDLCSQFEDYHAYQEKGIGVAALYQGELVAGASSYTVYSGGIEIEIDTKKEFRRKGLAYACGAQLILECMSRGIYPSWDAQNKCSLALAEKLGYHFEEAYSAYEVKGFG